MADLTQLLNPVNILDIAIVAIFIYKLISMVKGTRAVQLIKGLLLLLVLSAISSSNVLGLTTVNWILEQIKTMMLIAIPIVFQPELRRMLEQLGNSSLIPDIPGSKKNRNDTEVEHVVNQLVPFLIDSSRSHTGVLIALQREVGLNEYVNTGIKIHGHLTSQLLGNIFIVNTPLHDGAVIIRENRIMAAGCLLPLTRDRSLSSELGTRHRAAIGISEQADCVVLVVSEETGTISYTYGGHIYRHMDAETLRNRLRGFLMQGHRRGVSDVIQKWSPLKK